MMMPNVDYGLCEGCGACAELYPLFFEIRDEKAWLINSDKFRLEDYPNIPVVCPYRAISIE